MAMVKISDLDDVMETACNQCNSRFRLTKVQVQQAYGQVVCGECGHVFNALTDIKSYSSASDRQPSEPTQAQTQVAHERARPATDSDNPSDVRRELSLHEAMYGTERQSWSLSPFGWFVGILLLSAAGIAQTVYYQRYQLIESPKYQRQVLNLCQLLPCAETKFSSTEQIQLLERNVFTHPVSNKALMVSGSFVNQAPFAQKLPDLLISLFDVQGKLIANRVFLPVEYLPENKNRRVMQPDRPVRFRLEILDPGTDALTYEFEFY